MSSHEILVIEMLKCVSHKQLDFLVNCNVMNSHRIFNYVHFWVFRHLQLLLHSPISCIIEVWPLYTGIIIVAKQRKNTTTLLSIEPHKY